MVGALQLRNPELMNIDGAIERQRGSRFLDGVCPEQSRRAWNNRWE